jgi:hypothetical protein
MCALEKRITAIEATLTSSPVSSLRQIRSSRPAPGWLAEQVAITICRMDDSLTWNEEVISGCSGIQTPSFRTAFPETPHTP